MDRAAAPRWPAVLLALAIATVPLGVVVAVRSLPPLTVAGSDVAWLSGAFATALAAVAALASLASLVPALRDGGVSRLLAAGASAALAGGAVAYMAGAPSLAGPLLGATLLAAAAGLAGDRRLPGGRAERIGAAVAVLVAAEALALLAVMPPSGAVLAALARPLLGAAALAALAATVRAAPPMTMAGALTAAGAIGLAADRGGTLEGIVGLAVLAAGQLLAAAAAVTHEPAGEPAIEDRLPELAQRLRDAVLRFDGHLRLCDWNATAAELLALDAGSAGARIDDLLGVALPDLPAGDTVMVSRGGIGGLEVALHRSGDGIVAVMRDPGAEPEAERLGNELRSTIEELLRARRTIDLQRGELERAATVDALTGVASRGAILERLRTEVAQARRYRHPLAVVLLDVDRFGEINAAHGIGGGDSVLREVALRVRLRVREADALGRCGSDGFIATLPHTDEAGAATFADALRHRVTQRPVRVDDAEVPITVSIGVATMRPGEDLDLDGLLARVTEALDSARSAGGNRIALDRLHGLARLEDRHQPQGPSGAEPDDGGHEAAEPGPAEPGAG